MPNDNEDTPKNPNLIEPPEDQQEPVSLADQGRRVDPTDLGPARYSVSVHLDPDTIAAIGVPWWTKLWGLWQSCTLWGKSKVVLKALCALLAVSFANSLANKIVERPTAWLNANIDAGIDSAVAWLSVIYAAI